MSNMAYCRFHNTVADLRDCVEALENEEELSPAEEKEKERLIKLCRRVADMFPEED